MDIPGMLWNGWNIGSGMSMHWRLRNTRMYMITIPVHSKLIEHIPLPVYRSGEIVAVRPYLTGSPELYTVSIS